MTCLHTSACTVTLICLCLLHAPPLPYPKVREHICRFLPCICRCSPSPSLSPLATSGSLSPDLLTLFGPPPSHLLLPLFLSPRPLVPTSPLLLFVAPPLLPLGLFVCRFTIPCPAITVPFSLDPSPPSGESLPRPLAQRTCPAAPCNAPVPLHTQFTLMQPPSTSIRTSIPTRTYRTHGLPTVTSACIHSRPYSCRSTITLSSTCPPPPHF